MDRFSSKIDLDSNRLKYFLIHFYYLPIQRKIKARNPRGVRLTEVVSSREK